MPYKILNDLPDSVQHSLPKHAQEIYLQAFNHAFTEYKGDEITAHKVAWSAVKRVYQKTKMHWIKK